MRNSITRISILVGVFSFFAIVGTPHSLADESSPASTAVDNSKMNQGDQHANAVTADHAKQNVSDREIMSQIRKSVVQDQSLSTYAHNVKIIANNGVVTLKGPVRTPEEKQNIFAKATAVVGMENVHDQMTVKQ